jgi:hypothetical protein
MTLRCRPRERGDQVFQCFVATPGPLRTVSVYWVPAFAGTTDFFTGSETGTQLLAELSAP